TTGTLSPLANGAGWNDSDVTVNLSATDNAGGSGVKQVTYSASGAQTIASTTVTGATAAPVITAEGVTTVSFFATDNANNVEATKTVTVQIDRTPPTASIDSHPNNPTNSTSASFTFSGNDPLGAGGAAASGVDHFLCKLDGGSYGACTSPQSYSSLADGSHTFSVESVDKAGNTSTAASFTWLVDTTPPTTTGTLSPLANGAGWNDSDVTVNLSATDNAGGSGVKQVTYSASGAQTIPSTTVTGATAAPVITAEGTTTVSFYATDNAGNTETTKTVTVMIDKTPPTASIDSHPNNPTNSTSASFTFSGNDPLGAGGAAASGGGHFLCQLGRGSLDRKST